MQKFTVNKNGKLSKLVLNNIEDISFSAFMKILRNKDIKVNGKRVNSDIAVNEGDFIEIYYTPEKKDKYYEMYRDENILVINKKSGYTSESIYEELVGKIKDVKFIHRLDRNTSGIMIFALNEMAEKELLYGFKERKFSKFYLATVIGVPQIKKQILTAYLKKDSENSKVIIYDRHILGSVEIKTGYTLMETDGTLSKLKVELFTGKTHQIRAHLSHIGYPILGDGKYGDFEKNKKFGAKTQMLTASTLILNFKEGDFLYYLNGKKFEIKQ